MKKKVFEDEISRNLEIYMDEMLINSTNQFNHLIELKEIFLVLKQNNIRINLNKSIFNVMTRKFLGFILKERGIKVNATKC